MAHSSHANGAGDEDSAPVEADDDATDSGEVEEENAAASNGDVEEGVSEDDSNPDADSSEATADDLTPPMNPPTSRPPATTTKIPAKPRNGSNRCAMSWKAKGRSGSAICFRFWRKRPIGRASNCRSPPRRPISTRIPADKQPVYPGNREIERRIKSIIRWNAMAMVVRANKEHPGIGGHISTFASAATLYEVAFNHFFHGKGDNYSGDQIYFQGHASPGIYSRAFMEGRLTEEQLKNFRQELAPGGGLSLVSASLADAPVLGISRRCRWASGRSWPSIRPGSTSICKIAASKTRAIRTSGASSATAKPTSRKRSAPSRSPRARISTT